MTATTRPRAKTKFSRSVRWWLLALSWSAMVACGTIVPDPPPTETDRLDLVAAVPVAAGEIEFVRPPGTTDVSVVPLRPGLLVKTASVGSSVRVAWVADSAWAGPQWRVVLERPEAASDALSIAGGRAYASATGVDLGAGVLAWQASDDAPVLDSPLAPQAFDHASVAPPVLQASFADHPLGDLDGDGGLDTRDALVLLDRLGAGGWDDYALYHGDLDGNDASDVADIALMLDKLVDPTLPARLHVKPSQVSFVQLDPATDRDAIVLVANQGSLPFGDLAWAPPAGVSVEVAGGLAGQSTGLALSLPASARRGWKPGWLRVSGAGAEVRVRAGHLVLLVAGQSNASGRGAPLSGWPEALSPSVRMLGNDDRWRDAREPLDDSVGQVDLVSADDGALYSFGTRLGVLLHGATGYTTYLIPASLGGTSVEAWQPQASLLDRGTLFGSANFRGQVSAALQLNPIAQPYGSEGGPVTALVWYQGESDETAGERSVFITHTNRIMNAFTSELGAPVVYVQLASHCVEQKHVQQHAVGELQRLMETGSGSASARPNFHMVVAYDLPRSDCIHLSAFGQRVLAERIELAVREHVLGEDVDGTGPRLAGLAYAGGSQIVIRTTAELAAGALDPALFTVFEGSPGDLDDVENYYDNVIGVVSAARDLGDPTSVRLTLARAPADGKVPHVRYMAEPDLLPCCSNRDPSHPEVWETVAAGTVRAAASGLPLPAFGPLAAPDGP